MNDLERGVLQLVADTGSITEAAERLHYSYHHLRDVVYTARRKLGVDTTVQAVAAGFREGWLR